MWLEKTEFVLQTCVNLCDPKSFSLLYFSHCNMHLCCSKESPVLYSQGCWLSSLKVLVVSGAISPVCTSSSLQAAMWYRVRNKQVEAIVLYAAGCCGSRSTACNLPEEFSTAVPSAPFLFCLFEEHASVLPQDKVLLWDAEWLTLLQRFCKTWILNVPFVWGIEPQFASRMPGRTQSAAFVLDNEWWIF